MNSDSNTNKYDYMKGHDYINALFVGKYFILAFVSMSVVLTGIYSYYYEPKATASVVVKPGLFIGSSGEITPVITPKGLSDIIDEGVFNSLIQKKLKTGSKRPIKLKAYNLRDTDAIKITYETDNTSSDGLKILNELVAQLSTYYEKERALKLQTVSYKFIDDLRNQVFALELSKMKKMDEKRNLIYEKSLLAKVIATTRKDKVTIEEQIKSKEHEINKRQKEIEKLNLNIIALGKEDISLTEIVKHEGSIQVIQEPMISTDFTEKFFQNIFTIGLISFAFAIFIQFIIYDLKLGRK
jgi:hypothetical protein